MRTKRSRRLTKFADKIEVGPSLSYGLCQSAHVHHNNYAFGRAPERRPPPPDSPWKLFEIRCKGCQSYRLKLIVEAGEESGDVAVYLYCNGCKARERLTH